MTQSLNDIKERLHDCGFSKHFVSSLETYICFGGPDRSHGFEVELLSECMSVTSCCNKLYVQLRFDTLNGRAGVYDYSPVTDSYYEIYAANDADFQLSQRENKGPTGVQSPHTPSA